MKWGSIFWLAVITGLAFLDPHSTPAASKPVMAHYIPSYVAKPYSSNWGWHWTMNHFNPDVINASGDREIASWYYPL